MRRAMFAIGGLAASTTLLVVVKGTPAANPAGQDLAAGQAGAAAGEPSATASGKPAARRSKKPASKSPAAKAPTGNFQVTGPVVSNDYGNVQVRVSMSGTRLRSVQALEMPASSARSEQLSARVARDMAAEAVREQSADDLDTVSGASSTSASYRESLQAALDKAARGERD